MKRQTAWLSVPLAVTIAAGMVAGCAPTPTVGPTASYAPASSAPPTVAPTAVPTASGTPASAANPVPGDPLSGNGAVTRTAATYANLTTPGVPSTPIDDSAFAVPGGAAPPSHTFQGHLELLDEATSGGHSTVVGSLPAAGQHLPEMAMDFVQNGSYLIPAVQGLVVTGSLYWNYIIGPGRAWDETSDGGMTRAAFPFATVERNQNCIHNGVMTFLFDDSSVSHVLYQITAETCQLLQFDEWGQLSATYTPGTVAGALDLQNAEAAEVANRLPTKPIEALATDYPDAGIETSAFSSGISASSMTLFGVVYGGTNYVGGCATRHGTYAFCQDMRVPSYSTAKSAFAGLALERLGQVYGSSVYDLLLKSYVTEMTGKSAWDTPTFRNAADMATGNYDSASYMVDEDAATPAGDFIIEEPYVSKMAAALGYTAHHSGEQGVTWVYHTSDTFLLTRAMDAFLQAQLGPGADIFNWIRDGVFAPLHLSAGTLSTERTDNASVPTVTPTGVPFGGYGLFWTADDIAKLAKFLNNDNGKIGATQVLDPQQVLASLQRLTADRGVGAEASNFGAAGDGDGDGNLQSGGYRYSNGIWSYPTTSRVPGCNLRVPFMSGFGGITVAMMPNGASYYYFSDNNEFLWAATISELDKLSPMCAPTTTTVSSSANPSANGDSVTLTATVTSATRAWAPTGTVQFQVDGANMGGPCVLDGRGQATLVTSSLGTGPHDVVALYSPDGLTGTVNTTLTADSLASATSATVASTAGIHVGDTIVIGDPTGDEDEQVVSSIANKTIAWFGGSYYDHLAGNALFVRNTAGGGFAASTSATFQQMVTARPKSGVRALVLLV